MNQQDSTRIGLTILRIVVGAAFLVHGLDKQPLAFEPTVQMFMMWGMPAPSFTAMLAILLELVGGALLIAGKLVRPVSLALGAEMIVALFVVHLGAGFSFMQVRQITETGPVFELPGWEVNVFYMAAFACLALAYPSPVTESAERPG